MQGTHTYGVLHRNKFIICGYKKTKLYLVQGNLQSKLPVSIN